MVQSTFKKGGTAAVVRGAAEDVIGKAGQEAPKSHDSVG
jgi:hypothetical protein